VLLKFAPIKQEGLEVEHAGLKTIFLPYNDPQPFEIQGLRTTWRVGRVVECGGFEKHRILFKSLKNNNLSVIFH